MGEMGDVDGKPELRKAWMAKEAALPEDYIKASDEGIAHSLFALPEFQRARSVLFFYSIWREPDTHAMMRRALALGKAVALPRTFPKRAMEARLVASLEELEAGLVPSKFGIPEPPDAAPVLKPEELDFVVVPAVAFDRDGYRLGHGAGYYDAYLPRTRAFACGVARERMLIARVPREAHDIRVDCVATERGVLRFEA
ncbi:MAG: 5-formyltetrahydrofolate cyclo-ligase [Acidobacteriota bacterium]|jgi:5-formyltetrahydrofolate cyclo-ligase|nr:5-formyltetrahydrofolate cyclo-ligase [Acidobacteriota bacterium]